MSTFVSKRAEVLIQCTSWSTVQRTSIIDPHIRRTAKPHNKNKGTSKWPEIRNSRSHWHRNKTFFTSILIVDLRPPHPPLKGWGRPASGTVKNITLPIRLEDLIFIFISNIPLCSGILYPIRWLCDFSGNPANCLGVMEFLISISQTCLDRSHWYNISFLLANFLCGYILVFRTFFNKLNSIFTSFRQSLSKNYLSIVIDTIDVRWFKDIVSRLYATRMYSTMLYVDVSLNTLLRHLQGSQRLEIRS